MAEGTPTTQPRARSFIIKRPRLTKLLDESEARILLLIAPAGYGKTTLAREWLDGKSSVAWYSGGPSMADVAALAAEIAEALAPTEEELVERVRSLAARSQSPEVLARAIAASDAAKQCAILAIDDCHHATDSEQANAFVSELIARTEFRVVGTSRARPAWVTPRMLVYGEAAMLEVDELAFTDEEAREVLGSGSEANAELLDTAQGWPAVIGLAAIGERRRSPGPGVPSSNLYEFFAEDLFEAASLALRDGLFLLALGADAKAGVAHELFGVDRDCLFAEAEAMGFLSGERDATLLHPLLRGFLLSKLRRAKPSVAADAVRNATAALAACGCWDECLAALEAFPQPLLVTSILDQALVQLLAAGRTATVKRWAALSSETDHSDPIVVLAEAEVALREGDVRSAQVLGERAGQLVGAGDVAARAYVVAGRAAHLRDDGLAARTHCARAETLATSVETTLEALWIQFISVVEDAPAAAAAIFDRMQDIRDVRPEHALRVHNAKAFMLLDVDRKPRAAADEFGLATGLLAHVRDPVLRTNFLNLHAHILVVVGEYEAAFGLAKRQIAEAELSGLDFAIDHGLLRQAAAMVGLRRFRSAQRLISQLERSPSAESDHVMRNTNLMAARLRIATGDLQRAEILLRHRAGMSQAPWAEQTAYRGLVLGALGVMEESEACLAEAERTAHGLDAVAITGLGRAVMHVRNGDSEQALGMLDDALRRGCVDALITACRAFPELARLAGADSNLAPSLIAAFAQSRDVDLARRAGLTLPRELRKNEKLTTRELEVYELLVQGRTNHEIAQTLFISNSTTKVHVRHIFEKLGVHSRAEAARAAPDCS